MKQGVLAFIDNLKSVFVNRKNSIPKIGHHKPFISQIEDSEKQLSETRAIVVRLDDSKPKILANSLLFYFIERIVPIFKNWRARFDAIMREHAANISGHIKANDEFQIQRVAAYQILTQINAMNDESIFKVPEGDVETQGKAILHSYNKEGYLESHVVEMPQDKAANDDIAVGSSPTLR